MGAWTWTKETVNLEVLEAAQDVSIEFVEDMKTHEMDIEILSITSERIENIRRTHRIDIKMEISSNPSGTCVKLSIPQKRLKL